MAASAVFLTIIYAEARILYGRGWTPSFFMVYYWKYKYSMLHMREQMLRALLAHAQGDIAKHKANVEIYLEHPAGVGEHTDILESIEKELDIIAKYQDQIDIINKYFRSPSDRSTLNE